MYCFLSTSDYLDTIVWFDEEVRRQLHKNVESNIE